MGQLAGDAGCDPGVHDTGVRAWGSRTPRDAGESAVQASADGGTGLADAGAMHFITRISAVASLSLLFAGCIESGGKDDASAGSETSEGSSEPTTAGTQIVEPTASSSESGATDPGATEPASESSASESSATDTGDTDTDDTGMAIPEECVVADPSVTAAFSLAIGDWPEMSDTDHEIDVMCVIDTMDVLPEGVVHALTCDDAGTPRAVVLTSVMPSGGSPVWSAGDSVRLESFRQTEVDFGIDGHVLRMSAADDTPLLMGHAGPGSGSPEFDPIVSTPEFPCGAEDVVVGQPGLPFAVRFELGADAVTIVSGHRDVLPIAGSAEVFAIDLEEATTNYCCHFTRKYHVLIQRVMPL